MAGHGVGVAFGVPCGLDLKSQSLVIESFSVFGLRIKFVTVSDLGPLEAIAENKTEQKSAAKRRQRLLKAP